MPFTAFAANNLRADVGMLILLALIGSAFLGAVMLVAGLALLLTRTWRRAGVLVLGAGTLGALIGVILPAANHTPVAMWLLFGAAGFGWAGLVSLAAFVIVVVLGQPTRWADHRRGAGAA